jgi:hypothetical protein
LLFRHFCSGSRPRHRIFAISYGPNSGEWQRARLSRDIANITMDLDNVETIDVNAKGGADTITVDDLDRNVRQ